MWRYFIPVMLVCALALRVGWMLLFPADPVSDFRLYHLAGVSMATGHGYRFGIDEPLTADRPPGYPLLLAAAYKIFGVHLAAARALNLVLALATIVLAYLIARRIFRSEPTARITLAILAFFPSLIVFTNLTATENGFAFFVIAGVALAILPRRRLWTDLASGVAFGMAILTRPVAIVVPVVVLLAYLWRSEPRKRFLWHLARVALISVVAIAVTVPWIIRNERLTGRIVFATEGGRALLQGNNPYNHGVYRWDDKVKALVPPTGDAAVDDKRQQEYAFDYIRTHPLRTIKLFPIKLYHTFWPDSVGMSTTYRGTHEAGRAFARGHLFLWMNVINRYYLVVVAASIAGAVLLWLRRRSGRSPTSPLLPLAMTISLTFVYLLFVGFPRYHIPLNPWIAMYAGAFFAILIGEGTAVEQPSEATRPTTSSPTP